MSGCSAFSRIIWTCTKYTQSLKYLPTHQRWFYSFHVKSIRAVADGSCRNVSSESYIDSVRASLSRLRHVPRYFSDKADDKLEASKESSPGLLRRFNQTWHMLRYFSDKADDKPEASKESSPGLLRRFHQTYKEHGKILVCVHLVTSAVWASIFYCAAVRGVDVVPLLKWIGASERIIAPFTKPGVGHAAVTYLLYKLATPLRYTVTIGGTHLSVKYLRRWGYLPPIASADTIRSMVKTKIGEVRDQRSHRLRARRRKH